MFETYIYQPFFNILVGIYWLLGRISPQLEDMGIAVMFFSLVVRAITFPLTIASERSEEEKKKIVDKIKEIRELYAHDPIRLKAEEKIVMRGNLRTVLATSFNMLIQIIIIVMLYRIFTTGLEGTDYHLLYSFMPPVDHVNLLFLGKYDLSHTNSTLNLLQSAMIFVVEFLIALRSPIPVPRRDVILLQFILPLGSYFIFMFMPAGKKVFIITSLAVSVLFNCLKLLQMWIGKLGERFKPPTPPEETPLTAPPPATPN